MIRPLYDSFIDVFLNNETLRQKCVMQLEQNYAHWSRRQVPRSSTTINTKLKGLMFQRMSSRTSHNTYGPTVHSVNDTADIENDTEIFGKYPKIRSNTRKVTFVNDRNFDESQDL